MKRHVKLKKWYSKHAALRNKSKDWLVHNQDNVFDWHSGMSTRGLLFL